VGPQHEICFISPFWRIEFWGCSYVVFFICAHHFYSSNILWSVNNKPFIWMRWVVVIKKNSLFLAKLHAMRAFEVAEVKFHEFLSPALEWEFSLRHISYSDNTRIFNANAILMRIWILLTKLHDTSKKGECVFFLYLCTSFPKLFNGFYLDFAREFTLVIVGWIWPAHCTWYYCK